MKTCEKCQKPLTGRQKRFCSYQCSCSTAAILAKIVNTKPKTPKQCLCCGETFYPQPCEIKKGKGKYCSHKCANTLIRLKKVKIDFSGLSTYEIGYIAGFLDADGHISRPGAKYPIVQITNTDFGIIKWLVEKIPFSGTARRRSRNPKWNHQMDWRIRSVFGCYQFLVFFEPYLKVKQQRAKDVIIFLRERYHFD